MKLNADAAWNRMAAAMIGARDDCRRIHELINQAERDPSTASAALTRVKEMAAANADRLRLALKHPTN